MDLKFIGQGLDSNNNFTTGNVILKSLSNTNYNNFNAFVAFVSKGGVTNLSEKLKEFQSNGGKIRLYIGVDLNGTSQEALEQLLTLSIETYVVFSPNSIIYHPKIYLFEGQIHSKVIIGSSNFTLSGLFQNMEASVCVNFNNEKDENGVQFLSEIYEYYNQFINIEHPSCQLLTPEILDILIKNKIVLPEKTNRAKQNKINKEFVEKDANAYDILLKTFGKLKVKRPPKGYKKIVSKKEIIVEENTETKVIDEIITLTKGAMWIETGKMTGGSKNQLDLSKKGKNNGVLINGSVTYFGVDPNNDNIIKNINIHLGNKIYKNNPIDLRKGNSNWRILLKGVTDNGDKLTSISRMQLGQDGGFVKKILLFTKIDNINFKLEILDLEDKEKLIESSSIWGKMGNETTGRAYGFI